MMTLKRREAREEGGELYAGPGPRSLQTIVGMLPRSVWLWTWLGWAMGELVQIERVRNCGKRDLCAGRPPELLRPPNQMTLKQKRTIQCFCDEKCPVYGDCCIDVAPLLFEETTNKKCVPLSNFKGVYAISECWPGKGDELEELCKKTVGEERYHYTIDLPAYSLTSKNLYANIYCALCHGENPPDIEPLHFTMECANGSLPLAELVKQNAYQMGKLSWIIGSSECFLKVMNDIKGRDCVIAIDSCPEGSDLDTSVKCNSYSLPLVLGDDEVYKNAHCSICNDVDHTGLTCWHGYEYRTFPSLSILYDFQLIFDTCDVPEFVWDAILQECIKIYSRDNLSEIGSCENGTECYQPAKKRYMSLHLKIEGYLTIISISTSIVCLFFHIVLSIFLPSSKNIPGKILNSLSLSLLVAQILFLCGIEPITPIPADACQAVAVLIHFSFLSSFFWMNVMSFDIWQTFSNASFKGQIGRSHMKYALYAWGGAGLTSCVAIVFDVTDTIPTDYRPYFAAIPNLCWFGNRTGLAIFFFLPICILLLQNILLFTITVCWFQKQHSQTDLIKTHGRKEYDRLWLYIKLFVIMGLTWCCGMITSLANKPVYRYPFILLNGLQGTFLFIMFDLKTEIFQNLKNALIQRIEKRYGEMYKKNNCTESSKICTSNTKY